MRLFQDIDQLPVEFKGCALTIGNFDGVHLGHARIIKKLCQRAQSLQAKAVVFTFDPHPVRLLRPDKVPPPLTWTRRKVQLLGKLGVSAVVAYPTDRAMLDLSPADFFQQIVVDKLNAKAMIEGPNFYFGKDRAGDPEMLAQLCQAASISIDIVEPYQFACDSVQHSDTNADNSSEHNYVSSSRIRKAIAQGEVGLARKLLTEPYRVRGMVTHGAGRGAEIGFPTANLEAIDTMLPAAGVYAGIAVKEKQFYPAAINIGPNPTFQEDRLKVEAHLIDYQETLYGEPLELIFLERLREIQTFADAGALVAQLNQDVVTTKDLAQTFLS